jgi:pimeloyl-ACP methyl ester carboxylesterase/DNA-binding CsgD family transcriptional regulator
VEVATRDPSVGFACAPDGRRVAYGWTGSGPPLVMVPGWMSHVTELWTHPDAAAALDRLSEGHRFVWYDRLGGGLSDADRTTTSLDDDIDQLTAVLDAVDVDRTDLIGYSFGGPTAVAFAVRHPERVRHLVLYASLAFGGDLAPADYMDSLVSMIRIGWAAASSMLATAILPEGTGEDIRWQAQFQRLAMSPQNAADLLEYMRGVDVRDQLQHVRVPTTVVSPSGGVVIRMDRARELAAGIPGAQLVTVGGKTHDPFIRDTADVVDAILAAVEGRPRSDRDELRRPQIARPDLSPRELDVLRALADGASNKKIAAELGVSVATVERHLTNLYRKLDAAGRADAAVRGIRAGLVPGPR